jgi:hypothetical protein
MMPALAVASQSTDDALLRLLERLKADGYRFVTPTPATHARVTARPGRQQARDVLDVLGWNLRFTEAAIGRSIMDALESGGLLDNVEAGFRRSRLRVSSLGDDLFLHSAYPTNDRNAVFFGPDSYRFADLISAEFSAKPPRPSAHIVDIGTGSGVGAIVAARMCPDARIMVTDINAGALHLAEINMRGAGVAGTAMLTSNLAGIPHDIDVALANPPYIIDAEGRDYRDGGGLHGGQVALDMAGDAVARLAAGGRLILYTGSAIVDGDDPLRHALTMLAGQSGCSIRYRELDPDVFGEELDRQAYIDVDRIAVVAAIISRG